MQSFDRHPQAWLRIAGLAYLANIALGLFGEVIVRGSMVVPGDGVATAANILQAPEFWRLGLTGDLLMQLLDVPLIVAFHLLLRPVSAPLALMATVFNVVQTAVLAVNKLFMLAPLLLASTPEATQGASWLGPMTIFWVRLHAHGFGIGLLFFGMTCLLRGWLIVRATFLPTWLGVLLMTAGAGYLLNSFALMAAPSAAQKLFPWVLVPCFVGELALSLWLLVRGVDLLAWTRQRVATAA